MNSFNFHIQIYTRKNEKKEHIMDFWVSKLDCSWQNDFQISRLINKLKLKLFTYFKNQFEKKYYL